MILVNLKMYNQSTNLSRNQKIMGSTVSISQKDQKNEFLPIPKLVRHDAPKCNFPECNFPIIQTDDWGEYTMFLETGYNTDIFPQFAFTAEPISTTGETSSPKILPLLLD